MKFIETIHTVKVKVRQRAGDHMPLGPMPEATIRQMRTTALRQSEAGAAAQGAEVLDYTIHSVEVVDG